MNAEELIQRIEAYPYWYHRIELPGGIVTPGWAPVCAERYAIPDDLTGKRVLDVGAWDGYWTFEALKRGAAEVVAIDDFSDDLGQDIKRHRWETFDLCREALGFTARSGAAVVPDCTDPSGGLWYNEKGQALARKEISVYDVTTEDEDQFDIVFFFGILYHCRYPMFALDTVASLCKGAIYVETIACDDYSPYRGGMGRGFSNYEMVMEFYPQDQYAANPTNWWAPTIQCLGAMLEAAGFQEVSAWSLTDTPSEHAECRGFASGTKNPQKEPAQRPEDVSLPPKSPLPPAPRVSGVMSMPRLTFSDNTTSVFQAFSALKIPLRIVQGAYWGQCLERGMQIMIDAGADLLITVDYDTIFSPNDVKELLRLAIEHPEATAVVPIQSKRQSGTPLLTMRGRSGQVRSQVDMREFQPETAAIATGHFGLTVLRVERLLQVPHPWFWDQPNGDGMWHDGKVDADIWFWKQLEKHGHTVLLANRIAIGHLELMATWPDKRGAPIQQRPEEFYRKGKPEEAWQ